MFDIDPKPPMRKMRIEEVQENLEIALMKLKQQEEMIQRNQIFLDNILNKVTEMSDDVAQIRSMVEIVRNRC